MARERGRGFRHDRLLGSDCGKPLNLFGLTYSQKSWLVVSPL
jgi:hypothetical protein